MGMPENKVEPIELEKEEVIEGTPSEIEREKHHQHEARQSDVAPAPKSAAEIPSQNRPAEQIVPEVEDKQKAEQTSLIEKKQELSIGIKEIGNIIQEEKSSKGQSSSGNKQVKES